MPNAVKVAKPKKQSKAKPVGAGPRKPAKKEKDLRQEHAKAFGARLTQAIPEPICELDHKDAWTLVVATILSAQSTDKMINTITPNLFARWPTPKALADASQEDVEKVVFKSGFYRAKAKNIRGAARVVVDEFNGEVPRTAEELMKLPGVARKTANVVLGTAYRIPNGFTVDTHAGRVARRLQLTEHDDPNKVDVDLMALFPRETWIDMSHRFVLHGRYTCLARKPQCERCPLAEICPSVEAEPVGTWMERAKREEAIVNARGEIKEEAAS